MPVGDNPSSPATPRNPAHASSGCHPYDFDRSEMLKFIPQSARRVLDVGASRGGFLRRLRQLNPQVEAWGIEPNEEAALEASEYADVILCGYYPAVLQDHGPNHFDVIIFNDVLEHMADPWDALAKTHSFLSKKGIVVSSIPNIRHWTVLKQLLLQGRFDYVERGILDQTHLRFFTKSSMQEMFVKSGYGVISCTPIRFDSSWKKRLLMSPLGRASLDIRTQQYAIVATPNMP